MSAPPLPLTLRAMREGDRNFILSSWLRSYVGKGPDRADYDDARDMYADYAPVIRDLLARSTVLVACLADEPSSVVAWLAVEHDVIHYVLVKPRWRRLGVARWLLEDLSTTRACYTHTTSDARRCPIPAAWTHRRWKIWKESGDEDAERSVSRSGQHFSRSAA